MDDHIKQSLERERKPISFLDYPQLIGSAAYGVFITPEKIAEKFDLFVEQSFCEQLGMYAFVGFEKSGRQFGCRRYFGSPEKHGCMVSVLGIGKNSRKEAIADALDIDVQDVHYAGENW
ncbi:MAG: hypothetical protein ABJN22_06125 [Litorimonas sp.]